MTLEEHQEDLEGKSKTQLKKEMLERQDLGETLTQLPQQLLDKCNLPEGLLNAIAEYKRIPNRRGARKRQLQFIGKLMRKVDVEPIKKVLDEQEYSAELDKRRFHSLENIRDSLIQGDQDVLNELISKHPGIDIQHLRQLIRQATKEAAQAKPPAASRKIFTFLRELAED